MSFRASRRNYRNSPSPNRQLLGDTKFRYRDIDMRKNEIRLLRLLPGEEGSMVECEMFHNSLDDPRGYTALSYTWGIQEHTTLSRYSFQCSPISSLVPASTVSSNVCLISALEGTIT